MEGTMINIKELIQFAFSIILVLVVALASVILVAMMIPILVPVCIVGIILFIAWLWFNGGAAPRRNSKRDYPEDFQ
jgi:hypothetical protein